MPFYEKWINIVSYPSEPNKAQSVADRLNYSNAVILKPLENFDVEFSNNLVNEINERGFVITEDQIIFEDDDEFEITQITSYGKVIIWTKKRVWTLQNQGIREKLNFLPRQPQFSHFEAKS